MLQPTHTRPDIFISRQLLGGLLKGTFMSLIMSRRSALRVAGASAGLLGAGLATNLAPYLAAATTPKKTSSLTTGRAASTSATLPAAVQPARPASPLLFDGRPTGSGFVRYEDLYRVGDDVTKALGRLTTSSVVTFPEGIFECIGFNHNLADIGILVPKICAGIWGSVPASKMSYNGTNGTIFQVKPKSSISAQYVPGKGTAVPMRIMMRIGGYGSASYGNFHVRGTDQGHIYQGFYEYNSKGAVTVQDCLFSGSETSGVSPPGETFVFGIHNAPDHTITRCEFDGRRYSDGLPHSGLATVQNCDKGTWVDCYGHHAKASSMVIYQSTHIDFWDCRSEWNGIGANPLNGSGWNHERASAIRHFRPTSMVDQRSGNVGVHMTFSNDTWTSGAYGTQKNGTLFIQDPQWNKLLTYPDDSMFVQTWHPYSNGDTQTTAPVVVDANGEPLAKFKWVHTVDQQNK